MNRLITYLTAIVLLSASAMAQKVTIKGKVTDNNNNAIEIANVKVEGKAIGTVTDLKGNYSLTCESSDTLTLVYSMIGYQTRKRSLYNPKDTVVIDVKLPQSDYTLDGVEIVDQQRQMGSIKQIEVPEQMRLLPDASGNGVESIITAQAGVSSHSELSSQYNVRGGNFDENSVYVNGIEIFEPVMQIRNNDFNDLTSELWGLYNRSYKGFDINVGFKVF